MDVAGGNAKAGLLTAGGLALIAAVVGALSGMAGTYFTAKYAFDAKMVEIGVSVLSADPAKSDVSPARDWAINLVQKHSGHRFTEDTRELLRHHPIGGCTGPTSLDFSNPCNAEFAPGL